MAETSIEWHNKSATIELKRGVKQGDPLLPLLFNLVLDSLIDNLERKAGYDINDNNISVLAFGHNIILVSQTRE